MSFVEKLKAKVRAAREADSLDKVQRAMEEEERQNRENRQFGSPDWLGMANLLLIIIVILYLITRWHMR